MNDSSTRKAMSGATQCQLCPGPHRKRNSIQFVFFLMLAFLWCYMGSNATITVTTKVETRQKNLQEREERFGIDSRKDAKDTAVRRREGRGSSSLVVLSSVDDSFRRKNLDVSKRVPCGANKCFFRLNTDPNVGYLVQPEVFRYDKGKTPSQLFQTLEVSWEFAEQLRRDYNVTHFLLEPPSKVRTSKRLASTLNSNIWSEAHGTKFDTDRFPKGSNVFVQKVRLAPEPNLIVGCTATKRAQFQRNVDEFLNQVKDKDSFSRRFSNNLSLTRMLLKKEVCLFKDFQVMLDTEGHLYHLDFDRCFASREPEEKITVRKSSATRCRKTLDDIERQIERVLSGDTEDSSSTSSK